MRQESAQKTPKQEIGRGSKPPNLHVVFLSSDLLTDRCLLSPRLPPSASARDDTLTAWIPSGRIHTSQRPMDAAYSTPATAESY